MMSLENYHNAFSKASKWLTEDIMMTFFSVVHGLVKSI
jgi:hypothetical protein